jgi:hypothetical protein
VVLRTLAVVFAAHLDALARLSPGHPLRLLQQAIAFPARPVTTAFALAVHQALSAESVSIVAGWCTLLSALLAAAFAAFARRDVFLR